MDEGTDLVVYARDNGVCYNFRFKQFSQSSGTCVFQNEWIRFVREKALEAGTIVKCWWDKENRRFSVSCHSPGMIFRQLHSPASRLLLSNARVCRSCFEAGCRLIHTQGQNVLAQLP